MRPVEGATILFAQAGSANTSRGEVPLGTVVTDAFFVRAYYYYPSGYAMIDHSVLEIREANDYLVLATVPMSGCSASSSRR